MLQTILLVAVPALVTLTAAFYILHRISREEQELYRPHQFSARSGNWNTSRASGDDTVVNRRPRNGAAPQSHTGECVVCYEERSIVELFPCRHRSLCVDCVAKLISRNSKVCPLCRSAILGYSEVF